MNTWHLIQSDLLRIDKRGGILRFIRWYFSRRDLLSDRMYGYVCFKVAKRKNGRSIQWDCLFI